MTEPRPLTGILPVLPTLFRTDGSISTEATARVAEFARDCGVPGAVFPGVASEFNFLDLSERARLLAAVGEVFPEGRLTVGASGDTEDEVLAMVEAGERAGARSAMIMAPKRLGRDPAAQAAFFAGIAARTGIRIVLQNVPGPLGPDLTPDVIAAIVDSVPTISWVKEETMPPGPRITEILATGATSLEGIIGGAGARYLYDELDRGAVAAMPAVELSDLHVALHDAFTTGDRAKARSLYIRSLPILLVQQIFRMRLTKRVLMLRGLADNDFCRAPLPEFDPIGLKELEMMLDELSDVLSWRKPA